jgi:hypothetical protein
MALYKLLLSLPAVLLLAAAVTPAIAQDAQKCFAASDKVNDGDALDEAEKKAAHDACMRALADTPNVVQNITCRRPTSTSWATGRSLRRLRRRAAVSAARSASPVRRR